MTIDIKIMSKISQIHQVGKRRQLILLCSQDHRNQVKSNYKK